MEGDGEYFLLPHQDESFSILSSHGNPTLENNVDDHYYGYGHNTMNHHLPTSLASLESQFQIMGINGTERVQNVGSINRIIGSTLANYHEIPRGFNVFRSLLEDVKGNIVSIAKDEWGCRFLIKKLYEIRNPQEIELIFLEVKDDLHDLMMDCYGSKFLKEVFEVMSERQMNVILDLIIWNSQKLVQVCCDNYGSYAMQDFVRRIFTAEKLFDFTMALKKNIVSLANNVNAGYVIQECLTIFPNILCKEILNGVARNCILIATHKDGCCVIQKLLDQANYESSYQLVRKIIAYAPLLAPDPYGNYVLQFVIEKQDVSLNIALIVGRLEGKFVELSMNKFGSHVVENLLRNSNMRLVGLIIQEIMNSPQFLNVLQCRFGNYVALQALRISVGSGVHNTLVNSIIFYEVYLQDHPYGKKVLASARREQLKLQQLAT